MPKVVNHQAALFKTSRVFTVVGIGQVLTGEIIQGKVTAGNFIQLHSNDRIVSYHIDAVERIDYVSKNEVEVALIFDKANPDLQNSLEAILGETVIVTDDNQA